MARAVPPFSGPWAGAASAAGFSGAADRTGGFISSPTVMARRLGSATLADLTELGVGLRGARLGELCGQHPPQRARPRRDVRPPHPEQLEGRLVELGVGPLRSDRVGEVLELVHQIEEPVSVDFHSITSRRTVVRQPDTQRPRGPDDAGWVGLYPDCMRPNNLAPGKFSPQGDRPVLTCRLILRYLKV